MPEYCSEFIKELLSEPECVAFYSLQSELRRNQFILARRLLKGLLDELGYSGPVLRTEKGKPYIQEKTIDISISHSHELVAVAIGVNTKIGIDIEYKKSRRYKALYSTSFNQAEIDWLDSLPANQVCASFYRLWTAKEAMAKLTVTDLMTSLKQYLLGSYFSNPAKTPEKTNYVVASVTHDDHVMSLAYEDVSVHSPQMINIAEFTKDRVVRLIPSCVVSVYTPG